MRPARPPPTTTIRGALAASALESGPLSTAAAVQPGAPGEHLPGAALPWRPSRTSSTEVPLVAASETIEAASPSLRASGVRAIALTVAASPANRNGLLVQATAPRLDVAAENR